MTLGQEFHGFATTLGYDHQRLTENANLMFEINMGATAIGTGITTHPGYAPAVLAHLRDITGLDLVTADDLVEVTQARIDNVGVVARSAEQGVLTASAVRFAVPQEGERAGCGKDDASVVDVHQGHRRDLLGVAGGAVGKRTEEKCSRGGGK
jgi:hypothetical protein